MQPASNRRRATVPLPSQRRVIGHVLTNLLLINANEVQRGEPRGITCLHAPDLLANVLKRGGSPT